MADLKLSHETVQDSPKVVCLSLAGELDHSNGQKAESYFDELLSEESPQHVIVDLGSLTFAGSVFFSALVFWNESLKNNSGKLVLFGATSDVISTLRIFSMDRILTICDDRDAALSEANSG